MKTGIKCWAVKDSSLAAMIEENMNARAKVARQLKAFTKKIGASHFGVSCSWFSGRIQSVQFEVKGEADPEVFTRPGKEGFRKIRASRKDLHAKINEILQGETDLEPILKKIGIKEQFDGLSVWAPGFRKIGHQWYVITRGDKFKGSDTVERVSDVDYESLLEGSK